MSREEHDLRIDYVEFAVEKISASRVFFEAAFGWKMTDYGPDYTSFEDGRLSGGLRVGASQSVDGAPLVVLYALDLERAQTKIEGAGGEITESIFDFPGGRRFHFREPGGNILAVWSDRGA